MRKTLQFDPRTTVDVANDDELTAYRARIQAAADHAYELGLQAGRNQRPTLAVRFLRELSMLRWGVIGAALFAAVSFGAVAGVAGATSVLVYRAVVR